MSQRKGNVQCPECGAEFQAPFASRQTNNGHVNCQTLVYWLNTETPYEARAEPKASRVRSSGVGMRPDIKVTHKHSRPGSGFIYVERQEQNTSGTGAEKVANKIHKANETLRDRNVMAYYIVLDGKRLDLLQKVADDSLSRGGAYPHERLFVVSEKAFREKALAGQL